MRCSDDQWIIMFRLFQMEKIRGRIDPRVLDVPYRPTILLVINMDGRFFFCFFFWSHGILLVMSRWRAGYLFCWIEELRFNYLTQPTELTACMPACNKRSQGRCREKIKVKNFHKHQHRNSSSNSHSFVVEILRIGTFILPTGSLTLTHSSILG